MVRSLLGLLPGRSGATPRFDYNHYTDAVEDIERLKRDGRHESVEELCLWCIERAEREAQEENWSEVPPAYYRHLAIVYRKDERYRDEVDVLRRYVEAGGTDQSMQDRLERARELQAQSTAETQGESAARNPDTTERLERESANTASQAAGEKVGPKERLQSMDNYDFEYFVADLWERRGWETTVSSQAGDRGIDVVATKSEPYDQKMLIQAKRYGENTTVGSPDIQQYASLKNQQSGVDKVLVVTTNRFTNQATEIARKLNVKCIDGDDLLELVTESEATDLIDKYAPTAPPSQPNRARGVYGDSRTETDPGRKQEGVPTSSTMTEGWSTNEPSLVGRLLPEGRWEYVLAGFLLYVLSMSSSVSGSEVLLLAAWIGTPLAIYMDGIRWDVNHRRYTAIALIPVIGMFLAVWYLFKRWRTVGLERELEFDF